MRKYRVQEAKELEIIICNKCGKEIKVHNDVPEEDSIEIQKRWGYFSKKDNEEHAFDLCEKCYDEFVADFQIPIEVKER